MTVPVSFLQQRPSLQGKGIFQREFWNFIIARIRELCPTLALSTLRKKEKPWSSGAALQGNRNTQRREQGKWEKPHKSISLEEGGTETHMKATAPLND